MDYFNKAISPIDINGNPIRSGMQSTKSQAADIEAGGDLDNPFHSLKSSEVGSAHRTMASKHVAMYGEQSQQDDELGYEEIPLQPVDKGIFRRKLPTPTPQQQQQQVVPSDHDEETGDAMGGAIAGAGSFRIKPGSGKVSGVSPDSADEDEAKKNMVPASSKLRNSANSVRSMVSDYLGIATKTANSDSNMPLVLKNDDNFLEHRKLLVQRWKDNIQDKMQNQSSFRDDRFNSEEVNFVFALYF